MEKDIDIKELIGEVLTYIDIDPKNDVILLTTQSGRQIRICHYQDCCESVYIENTDGKWHELFGKPILDASHEECSSGNLPEECYEDSWTRTTLTFKTDKATVINRWIGTSNGYYSESVSLIEI